ncbi:hypothetical protein OS188_07730 [Xanthomarina sp. F1114]|uniref:hypothetical protein n=1 Tax=Xanthomarina sp. F1114 TaxID=2996019 RepID=UPI00225DD337|nr:hypothetical protein [Xanthomarina sp. F1114]MCX7547839.1 hypothetical protein [Xanthomarina sp. F1114]
MNKFLIFLLALTVNFTFAQSVAVSSGNDFNNSSANFTSTGVWIKNVKGNSKLKGSPYLFDSWNNTTALIYAKNNKAYKFRSVNYNVQMERFEAKFSEDSILAFNPGNIEKVVIDGRTFKRYLDAEFQRNSYFEELVVTKSTTILRKHEIGIKEGMFNPLTQQKTTDDSMIIKEKYFYTTDNENLKLIKLKRSSILKMVEADKKNILKQYAKDNDLSFKDITDLKKIFGYYNTL